MPAESSSARPESTPLRSRPGLLDKLAAAPIAPRPSPADRANLSVTFRVSSTMQGGEEVLVVRGDLDLSTASVLTDAVSERALALGQRVPIDLGSVTFLDCAGLHALDHAETALRRGGGSLVVTAISPSVALILRLVQKIGPRNVGPGNSP